MKETQGIIVNTEVTVLEMKNVLIRRAGTLTSGPTAWLETQVVPICLLISTLPEQ